MLTSACSTYLTDSVFGEHYSHLTHKHEITEEKKERIRQASVSLVRSARAILTIIGDADTARTSKVIPDNEKPDEYRRLAANLRNELDKLDDSVAILDIELPKDEFVPINLHGKVFAVVDVMNEGRHSFDWPDAKWVERASEETILVLGNFPRHISKILD